MLHYASAGPAYHIQHRIQSYLGETPPPLRISQDVEPIETAQAPPAAFQRPDEIALPPRFLFPLSRHNNNTSQKVLPLPRGRPGGKSSAGVGQTAEGSQFRLCPRIGHRPPHQRPSCAPELWEPTGVGFEMSESKESKKHDDMKRKPSAGGRQRGYYLPPTLFVR